jgi:hypothetical protein
VASVSTVVLCAIVLAGCANLLRGLFIDRTKPFDPATIACGDAEGAGR